MRKLYKRANDLLVCRQAKAWSEAITSTEWTKAKC